MDIPTIVALVFFFICGLVCALTDSRFGVLFFIFLALTSIMANLVQIYTLLAAIAEKIP